MRPSQIEAWAIAVWDRVRASHRNEDARVEIKREFISPRNAARRLAGHANAARGEAILWLIGIDEANARLHPVRGEDLADWLPQVHKEFQGPSLPCSDVVVHVDESQFLALHFSTDQAPYVVRNKHADGGDAGPATLEVPWREGTAVRTATHADLLRLLVPISTLPDVELVECNLKLVGVYVPSAGRHAEPEPGLECEWQTELTLFVTPQSRDPVIFPIHRCSLVVEEPKCLGSAKFRMLERQLSDTWRLLVPANDYVVDRPRRLCIRAHYKCRSFSTPANAVTMRLLLRPAGLDREIRLQWSLERVETEAGETISFRVARPLA